MSTPPTTPREIFVFGSNREGRHGAGAAKYALDHYGAIYGKAEGLQGSSYAIVTKELRHDKPVVTLAEVAAGIGRFLEFAHDNPHLTFNVTPIGCGLAGFDPWAVAPFFTGYTPNIRLPDVFRGVLGSN